MSDRLYVVGTWERAAVDVIVQHELESTYGHPTPYRDMFDSGMLMPLARRAWGELNEDGHWWTLDAQVELLARKQHDYGHQNINKFGEQGVLVRLWDKIARYENLVRRGVEPENESLRDTLTDIIGYCVIWQMLKNNTFQLPLECDL